MKWLPLKDQEVFQKIIQESFNHPVFIFKHSTRCSISTMALNRLERQWNEKDYTDFLFYYLDLLQYRSVSDQIAQEFSIQHESPQLLLIQNGQVKSVLNHSQVSLI